MTPPAALSTAPVEGESIAPAPPPVQEPIPLWRSVAVLALAVAVWLFFWANPPPVLSPTSGVVMHLPGYVDVAGGLVGENTPVSVAERTILPKDTEFARKNYHDTATQTEVFCSIVLSGATGQSIHRPEVCLIAQGWTIANQEDIPITLPSGHQLVVRNLTIQRDIPYKGKSITVSEYNMYWFVGENVTTPSHATRIFLSSWDRIFHNRAHRWAYVTVSAPITGNLIPNGRSPEETKDLLVNFIKAIVPTFQKSEMEAAQP
jgi:hypothetical protein